MTKHQNDSRANWLNLKVGSDAAGFEIFQGFPLYLLGYVAAGLYWGSDFVVAHARKLNLIVGLG